MFVPRSDRLCEQKLTPWSFCPLLLQRRRRPGRRLHYCLENTNPEATKATSTTIGTTRTMPGRGCSYCCCYWYCNCYYPTATAILTTTTTTTSVITTCTSTFAAAAARWTVTSVVTIFSSGGAKGEGAVVRELFRLPEVILRVGFHGVGGRAWHLHSILEPPQYQAFTY